VNYNVTKWSDLVVLNRSLLDIVHKFQLLDKTNPKVSLLYSFSFPFSFSLSISFFSSFPVSLSFSFSFSFSFLLLLLLPLLLSFP